MNAGANGEKEGGLGLPPRAPPPPPNTPLLPVPNAAPGPGKGLPEPAPKPPLAAAGLNAPANVAGGGPGAGVEGEESGLGNSPREAGGGGEAGRPRGRLLLSCGGGAAGGRPSKADAMVGRGEAATAAVATAAGGAWEQKGAGELAGGEKKLGVDPPPLGQEGAKGVATGVAGVLGWLPPSTCAGRAGANVCSGQAVRSVHSALLPLLANSNVPSYTGSGKC